MKYGETVKEDKEAQEKYQEAHKRHMSRVLPHTMAEVG